MDAGHSKVAATSLVDEGVSGDDQANSTPRQLAVQLGEGLFWSAIQVTHTFRCS